MKFKCRLAAAILLLCIFFSMIGCAHSSQNDGASNLIQSLSPAELYQQAVDKLTSSNTFGLQVIAETYITTGGQTLTETATQSVQYTNFGTDAVQARSRQTFTYGSHTFSCYHSYGDGIACLSMSENHFTSEITFEEYSQELSLPFLPDISLYDAVQAKESGSRILIGLSHPKSYESWAALQPTDTPEASASMLLDAYGNFLKCTYSLTYTAENTTVLRVFTFTPALDTAIALLPAEQEYTPISNLSAPLLLERSCGYLYAAEDLSSESVETITCQISGLDRMQTTRLTILDANSTLDAAIDTKVELTDKARSADPVVNTQTEIFRNGVYKVKAGGIISENTDITTEIMANYCRDILVKNIPMAQHLEHAAAAYSGIDVLLSFDLTEDFAKLVCAAACNTLYQDPAVLESLSTSYATDTIVCTLRISAVTGLPLSVQIAYQGTYTIDDNAYTLLSQTEQTYSFD